MCKVEEMNKRVNRNEIQISYTKRLRTRNYDSIIAQTMNPRMNLIVQQTDSCFSRLEKRIKIDDLHSYDTLGMLKQRIEDFFGISSTIQRLFLRGPSLPSKFEGTHDDKEIKNKDDTQLHLCGIKGYSSEAVPITIGILLPKSDSMQIFVKDLTGQTLTLQVEKWAGLLWTKRLIQEKTGIYVSDQRLLFAGKQLDNESFILSDYGIARDTTIHLVLRLRAGMFHPTSGRNDFSSLSPSSFDLSEKREEQSNEQLIQQIQSLKKEILIQDVNHLERNSRPQLKNDDFETVIGIAEWRDGMKFHRVGTNDYTKHWVPSHSFTVRNSK